MREFVVRPLVPGDLAQYKALRDEMLALHPEAFTSDAEDELPKPAASYLSRLGLQPADGVFTLGAWRSLTPSTSGLVGAITSERDMRRKAAHILHLVGMMVHPSARKCGVGKALVLSFIDRARIVAGVELITLSVTSTNAAARALYEHAGFRRYGRLPRAVKLGDDYLDKDLMVLEL